MKTRKEWFDTLPSEIRERAIANTKAFYKEGFDARMLRSYQNMDLCISTSFEFDQTVEGREVWTKIADGYYESDKPESDYMTMSKFQLPKD